MTWVELSNAILWCYYFSKKYWSYFVRASMRACVRAW